MPPIDERMDKFEEELREIRKNYPTAYLTQAEFHVVMTSFSDRLEQKMATAFDKHQRDHVRLERGVQKNEDRIDGLRNIGTVIAAAATTFGIWLGLR